MSKNKKVMDEEPQVTEINIQYVLYSIAYIMVLLKVGNIIDWSWVVVFAPIVIPETIMLLLYAINGDTED